MLTDGRGRLLSLQCPICGVDLYGLRKEPPMATHNLGDSFPPGTKVTKVTKLDPVALACGHLRDVLYHNNVNEYAPVKCQTETGKILSVVSVRLELEDDPAMSRLVLEVIDE